MHSMDNIQFFTLIGVVLGGVVWSRIDNHQLSGRIDRMNDALTGRVDRLSTELSGRIDRVQSDLSQFYRSLGEHDKAIVVLEKK